MQEIIIGDVQDTFQTLESTKKLTPISQIYFQIFPVTKSRNWLLLTVCFSKNNQALFQLTPNFKNPQTAAKMLVFPKHACTQWTYFIFVLCDNHPAFPVINRFVSGITPCVDSAVHKSTLYMFTYKIATTPQGSPNR